VLECLEKLHDTFVFCDSPHKRDNEELVQAELATDRRPCQPNRSEGCDWNAIWNDTPPPAGLHEHGLCDENEAMGEHGTQALTEVEYQAADPIGPRGLPVNGKYYAFPEDSTKQAQHNRLRVQLLTVNQLHFPVAEERQRRPKGKPKVRLGDFGTPRRNNDHGAVTTADRVCKESNEGGNPAGGAHWIWGGQQKPHVPPKSVSLHSVNRGDLALVGAASGQGPLDGERRVNVRCENERPARGNRL